MLRFAVLSVLLASAFAGGNYGGGSYGGSSSSYGARSTGGNYGSGNFGGFSKSSNSYGGNYGKAVSGGYSGGVIQAAVQSRRNVQFIDVPSSFEAAQPLTLEIGSQSAPINFLFKSRSSDINLQSAHESSPGSYQETSSQDEPHVLVHTVTRPIVNEVREIITPYRRVKQEIQPVQESIETLVSKGQQQQQGYNQGGYSQGGYSQGNQGGYQQGGYSQGNQGGYQQSGFSQGGYSQGKSFGGNRFGSQGGYSQGGY